MKTVKKNLPALFLIFSIFAFSQDGTLDDSFGGNGYVVTDFYNNRDWGIAVAQQNDGKIITTGSADDSDNNTYNALVRYNTDGTLDSSFGINGKVATYIEGSYLDNYNSILFQNDNKIIAGGYVGFYTEPNFLLTRYMPNGDLDPTFGNNGIITTNIYDDYLISTELLNDGKILAGGFSKSGDDYYVTIIRYLPNGSLDLSFGNEGVTTTYLGEEGRVFNMVILDNGKILIGARKLNNFHRHVTFLRYLEDGNLDTSFGDNGIVITDILGGLVHGSFAVKNNGEIIAAVKKNSAQEPILAQFNSDGSPDLSFGENGEMTINSSQYFVPLTILTQEDGKILVQGNIYGFEVGDFRLQKFNQDGTPDTDFGSNGVVTSGFESSNIFFQNDEKILIVGYTFWYNGPTNFVLARYHNNGSLSVSEQNKKGMVVSPNPSSGIFKIHHDVIASKTPYQITDITGKLIQTGELTGGQTIINLSTKQSGMYFLNTSGKTYKLIKN